jgi:subtilisin family serine protease
MNEEDVVAVDPRLDREQEGDPDDLIDVVVRLKAQGVLPEGLIVAAELGDVVTGQIRRGDIRRVHDSDEVESVKTSETLIPERRALAIGDVVTEGDDSGPTEADERRPRTDPATGRGSIVAVVDWWFDLPHAAFRREDGKTRVPAFWDQRATPGPGTRPSRYGYGRVLDRATIDRALAAPDPYTALAYRPWEGDPAGEGTHGTHVAGIAAGGRRVRPIGVAPEADLLLVHLVDRNGTERSSLGSSKSLLDAVDWIARTAGSTPWALDLSMGRYADAHLGRSLVERALDAVTTTAPGRFCAQSTGNYYRNRTHAAVLLDPGDERTVRWEIPVNDPTPNELEIWYSSHDSVVVELRAPDGRKVRVAPGQRGTLSDGSREFCRVAHRRNDPNTGLNNAICFLDTTAPAGTWVISLSGLDITDGRIHLWVERDSPAGQSHFHAGDAVVTTTTGSICNGFHTAAIGAYDAAATDRQIGRFSSVGRTVDGRRKPLIAAPGVNVLSAKSAPAGSTGTTDGTTRKSGTSMAAPHVAGMVALMYEAAGRPLTASEIRHLLVQTADPIADTTPDPERYGHGYLNMDRCLERTRQWVRDHPTPPRESEAPQEPHVEAPIIEAVAVPSADTVDTERIEDDPATLWRVTSADARLRHGPPDFALDGNRRCAQWDRVLVLETSGRYRRIGDAAGTSLGWTAAANLFPFLRDVPRLASAALAAGQPVAVPASGTARAVAQTYNRIGGIVTALATELGIEPAAVLAVWQVESGGRAYTAGRTVLRVENHLVYRRWGAQNRNTFDQHLQFGTHPPLSATDTFCGSKCDQPWRCHRSRQSPTDDLTCDHTSQQREQDVLALVTRLAGEEIALQCSSLGGPQILGSNHAQLGYASAVAMRDAFIADERWEVIGFFDFCRRDNRLISALHDRRWADFARIYNGPGQVQRYGQLVEDAYTHAAALLAAGGPAPASERWTLAAAEEAAEEAAEAFDIDACGEDAGPNDEVLAAIADELADPAGWFRDAVAGADSVENFVVVGRPGEPLDEPLVTGDVVLRNAPGQPVPSSVAVVASPHVWTEAELREQEVNAIVQPGDHVEAFVPGNGHGSRLVPLRVRTPEGLVPSDVVALRPLEAPDLGAMVRLETEGTADESLAIPVPTTPWPASPTLLRATEREHAVAANAQRHPAQSQLEPATIRARVDQYIDLAAVTQRLTAAGVDPAAGMGGIDNALCEALHQFQLSTVVRGADGIAGPQTLDDLGLVDHRLRTAPGAQGNVDRVLEHRATAVQQAGGGATAANWWRGIAHGSFLGHPIRGGVHRILMRRLRRAERALLGVPRFSQKTPVQLGVACGIGGSDDPSGWRPSQTATHMHAFGLAIDVAPFANPYVGGNADAAISNVAFSHAMQRAALLISNERLPESFSSFLGRLGATADLDTAGIHRILSARDADLRAYLALAHDDAALRARLVGPDGALRRELAEPGETIDQAVVRWHGLITTDAANLALPGSNFSPGRDPRNGFLNLPVELVVALRDGACLAWGAVDFGPRASGDMMHFDTRVDGVGRILIQSTPHSRGGWAPTTAVHSNHPCARAAAASEAELIEITTETAVDDRLATIANCPIDAYAYDPTGTVCSGGPAAGTLALRRILREQFGQRHTEIYNCRPVRGGTSLSLHAEGRAVDFYVNAAQEDELALGNRIVQWLLASDAAGNPHANARRLGVQELIWNHQMWTAGRRSDEGMRPYSGVDPHTTHLHIGQNRLGSTMGTTYWIGC